MMETTVKTYTTTGYYKFDLPKMTAQGWQPIDTTTKHVPAGCIWPFGRASNLLIVTYQRGPVPYQPVAAER